MSGIQGRRARRKSVRIANCEVGDREEGGESFQKRVRSPPCKGGEAALKGVGSQWWKGWGGTWGMAMGRTGGERVGGVCDMSL